MIVMCLRQEVATLKREVDLRRQLNGSITVFQKHINADEFDGSEYDDPIFCELQE